MRTHRWQPRRPCRCGNVFAALDDGLIRLHYVWTFTPRKQNATEQGSWLREQDKAGNRRRRDRLDHEDTVKNLTLFGREVVPRSQNLGLVATLAMDEIEAVRLQAQKGNLAAAK